MKTKYTKEKCSFCDENINKRFYEKRTNFFCNIKCKANWQKINFKSKNNPFFGKKHTKETKEILSKVIRSEEHNGMYGKKHSKMTIQKLSIIRKEFIHENPSLGFQKGEKNLFWYGGLSRESYTPIYSQRLKEFVRNRDHYCCQICNKSEEERQRKLSIHHIDYIKVNSFPQNLVALCVYCHSKTNNNREHWIKFFQSLLSKNYKYKYTKDQKTILEFK